MWVYQRVSLMRHNTGQSSSTASPTLFGHQGQQLFFFGNLPQQQPHHSKSTPKWTWGGSDIFRQSIWLYTTRWWFQRFAIFNPILEEMIQFDLRIFFKWVMGWNHHLDHDKLKNIKKTTSFLEKIQKTASFKKQKTRKFDERRHDGFLHVRCLLPSSQVTTALKNSKQQLSPVPLSRQRWLGCSFVGFFVGFKEGVTGEL